MAKLNLVIRSSKPNVDGSFNIKVSIAARGQTCFLSTPYTVNSAREWRAGKVIRRGDADLLNRKLMMLLLTYEDCLAENPCVDGMTAVEVRNFLVRSSRRTGLVCEYGERFVKELKDNGQSSYAQNMGYSLRYLRDCFGEGFSFGEISVSALQRWERFLFERGSSATTVNIRMTHLKALVNAAIDDGEAEYKVHPFRKYRLPQKSVRDICITREELAKLREAKFEGVSQRRFDVARDLFMLSFYCGGINLTDLLDADLCGEVLTFVRKKTANKKQGEKQVSITIQPEAREIINKYLKNNRLDLGYHYRDYGQFRSFVTKSLNRIGELLGFEKRLMFYSARKTFCQFGFELGIPLYILEYAIGQSIKEESQRPIFNYIKIMREQADTAVRAIVDYSLEV